MRACQNCDRIIISRRYMRHRKTRTMAGMIFVYIPILFLPFILISAWSVYLHLRITGAENLKTLGDFLPDRASHRYSYKTQITFKGGAKAAIWSRTRAFWIFNCTWYCPFSVGLLEWFAYLVKAVENWWCPFGHARVDAYAGSSIDRSYWHDAANLDQLHPDDRDNPIFADPDGKP